MAECDVCTREGVRRETGRKGGGKWMDGRDGICRMEGAGRKKAFVFLKKKHTQHKRLVASLFLSFRRQVVLLILFPSV